MGLFDKLFAQNEPKFKPSDKLGEEIINLIFNWFKEAEKTVKEFEEHFYYPILKEVEADEWQRWFFENERELTVSRYYVTLASFYLACHHPHEFFLSGLMNHVFDKNGNLSKDNFRSNEWSKYQLTNEQLNTIYIGFEIIRSFQAAISKKDMFFSDISSVANSIGQRAFIKEDIPFKKIFNFVTNLKFKEKIYYILSVHATIPYGYGRDKAYSEENQFESVIKEAFEHAVIEYNSESNLQLSSNIIWDYHKAFHSITNSDVWTKADSNKRKYLSLKNFPETSLFVEKYRNNANEVLQNIIYLLSIEYIDKDKNKIYKELLDQLIKDSSFDLEWITNIVTFYRSTRNYDLVFNCMIISFLETHASKIPINSPLIKKIEALIFKRVKDVSPTRAINLMNKLCDKIENESKRAFEKLKYSEVIANCYFHHPQHYLVLESKSVMMKRINCIVDQLNQIVPTGLKSYKHPTWYSYDEVEFLKLNINGQDLSLPFDLVAGLNNYLVENKVGYQFLPIPMLETKNRDNKVYHVSILAFINQAQFILLKEYVGEFFPPLLDAPAYKNADFSEINDPSIYELNHSKIISTERSPSKPSIENDGTWSWFKNQYLNELSSKEKWYEIVPVLSNYKGGKKPNKAWLKEIDGAIDSIGRDQFFRELAVIIPPSLKEDFWFLDNYVNTLKGIIITCTTFATDASLGIVKDIIGAAYTKIPEIGPRSTVNGNFAIKALTESGNDKAFGILNIIRNKTKYQRLIKVLDKSIEEFAKYSDSDPELLADKSIPRLGFEGNSKVFSLVNYQQIVSLQGQRLKKIWVDEAGNTYKSTPEKLINDHPKKLKEIAEEIKQASALFNDLKFRVKTYWLNNREWTGSDWDAYVFSHPLIYPWIEGMIWRNETKLQDFIIIDNSLLTIDNHPATIDTTDIISLWHPIAASPENISSWQEYIISRNIIQPERQVFREHYPFSKNEQILTASPRFAHHFLEVKKLMALANASGWIFSYVHEDVNWPRLYIKALNITVHIQCDYSRFDEYIPTKDLIITKGDTTKISYNSKIEGLTFESIPKKTLSEISRDIDLFIAITSVANNPDLSEKSELLGVYRNDFLLGSFSENANAKQRKEILQSILKKMGISDFVFEGNFIVFSGEINRYRINLGSGFAQVYDSQKHLTILPDTSKIKRKYELPLIEDETLNIIIAKILFLKDDNKIADDKILKLIKTA